MILFIILLAAIAVIFILVGVFSAGEGKVSSGQGMSMPVSVDTSKLDSHINALQEATARLMEENERLRKELESAHALGINLENQLSSLRDLKSGLSNQIEQIKDSVSCLRDDPVLIERFDSLEKKIVEYKQTIDEHLRLLQGLGEKVDKAYISKEEYDNIQRRLQEQEREFQRYREDHHKILEERELLKKQLQEKELALEQLKQSKLVSEEEYQRIKKDCQAMENILRLIHGQAPLV